MNDNKDQEAGDDVYSCIVPFSDSGSFVQYYVRASNEDAISLSIEKRQNMSSIIHPLNEIMASNDQTEADEYFMIGLKYINASNIKIIIYQMM